MYIEREIDKDLQQWRDDENRKPLLLRGVRQCGKTSCVRNLGRSFKHYAELNLERQTSLHRLFEGDLDIRRIVANLEVATNTPILPGQTLLFIDEIQACPRAITALRYFYEDLPGLHVIAAGSLLEFVLNNKRQKQHIDFPVGRIRSLYLYPFSFLEFLHGTGKQRLHDYLQNLSPETETNDLHERLLEEYKAFLIVGGMPEAVAAYGQSGSFLACQQVHEDILLNFRDDFGKYDNEISGEMILKVFDYAIHHVCQQTKATSAIPGISAYLFEESIRLLQKAGLVFPVSASACDTLPLGTGIKESNQKLLFFDTGIYLSANQLSAADILAAEVFEHLNKGSIVEMAAGLEIIKAHARTKPASLYYWYRSGANAEVDYVVQKGNAAVPVEVKASGKGSMQSMFAFLKQFPDTPYGIRVSMENFVRYDQIHVYPVYAASKIV